MNTDKVSTGFTVSKIGLDRWRQCTVNVFVTIDEAMNNPEKPQPLCSKRDDHIESLARHWIAKADIKFMEFSLEGGVIFLTYKPFHEVEL